jgi:flagellum-specific peptidoglycan hydrolase FlgJ
VTAGKTAFFNLKTNTMKTLLFLTTALFLIGCKAHQPEPEPNYELIDASEDDTIGYATPCNLKNKATIPTHVDSYIKRFLKTAKKEAELFNIPVSIKLAQGILESAAGQSDLSKKHNNHFGIKYRGSGKYAIYRDDTPRDRFQVYKSAWQSYRDHSKLLCIKRYSHLRKLPRCDYKSWAEGLKKAGYATAPHYAQSLIKVIETYELYKYDI